jgi:hypothetical protein
MDRIRLDDRYIPPAVKRAVWARDGGRCAFVGQPERRRELAYVHSPRDEWGSPYLSRTIRARLDR